MYVLNSARALVFYAGYAVSVVLHSTFMLCVARFLPYPRRYRLLMVWNRFALRWVRWTCGVKYDIVGAENLPDYPVIVISNHQSAWETIFLPTLFPQLCTLLKRELLRIPFFGWALAMMRPVAIDRSNPRDALKQMMGTAGRRLREEGCSVLIFPEGTRVAPGLALRFARGAGQLASHTGVPIVCVAHDAGRFWPTGKLAKKPGVIRVTISEPFATAGYTAAELTELTRDWIQSRLDEYSKACPA